jgi:acyl-coenzyme A thioesterase PaaI-like protein
MRLPPVDNFIAHLGFENRDTAGGTGSVAATVVPELCVPGTERVRPSLLLTLADVVAGSVANQYVAPRICMTLDLDVRVLRPAPLGRIIARAEVLKSGRNTTSCETWFVAAADPDGDPFAVSHSTFVASPRPEDVMEIPPGSLPLKRRPLLTRPLADDVGCRILAPGVAEVDVRDYVVNPTGTVQGGIVALLAELAAETVTGDVRPVTELDVRYLATTRVGPARAEATLVGPAEAGIVRVELRDVGRDGRLAALVTARLAPPA